MNDEELLKSAGLFGTDMVTGKSGYNLAAIMLLGKDDVFRITVPLDDEYSFDYSLDKVSTEVNTEVSTEADTEVGTKVSIEVGTDAARKKIKLSDDKLDGMLKYCSVPRTRQELQAFCKIKTEKYFRDNIIKPLLEAGMIVRTIPDKPKSSKQRYVRNL